MNSSSKFGMVRGLAVISLAIIALGASGCGRNLRKLTAEEKAQFGEVLEATGNAQRAVPKNGVANFAMLSTMDPSSEAAVARPVPAPVPGRSNSGAMRSRLEREQGTGHCKFDINMGGMGSGSMSSSSSAPSAGIDLSNLQFDIHVAGQGCPLSMDLMMKMKPKKNGMDGDFVWNYAVADNEYKQLNDVIGAKLKGTIEMTGDAKGTSQDGEIDIKGTIVSQKYGELPVELTGNMSSSSNGKISSETTLYIKFKDFGAELKHTQKDGKAKYFINNEELSEQEFNEYLQKLFAQG